MNILEIIEGMIISFLHYGYDPLQFSHDLPDVIVDNYDKLEKYDPIIAKKLDDTFPDICSEYEMGDDPTELREKVKTEYKRIFGNT